MKHSKLIMLLLIFSLFSSIALAEKYYVLDISKKDSGITFNKLDVEFLEQDLTMSTLGEYDVVVLSASKSVLHRSSFSFSNGQELVYVRYSENADKIEIRNSTEGVLLELDVKPYSDVCGDNLCQSTETLETCPLDCKEEVKTVIIKEPILETLSGDRRFEPEYSIIKEREESRLPVILISSSIIFLSLIVLVFSLFIHNLKQRRKIEEYLVQNINKGYSVRQISNVLMNNGYKKKDVGEAIDSIYN